MRSQIIQIGNSQGIRLPKKLLEESGISGEVDIEIHPDGILIRNLKRPCEGWDEAFRAMAENEDDELEDENRLATRFEEEGWQW